MDNQAQKKVLKQTKMNRRQQIQEAQSQWNRDFEQLEKDKVNLGHGNLRWEDFLELNPDDFVELVTKSNILALQEKYRTLLEQRTIIWAEGRVVTEFNKSHAVVHIDQTYIMTEKINILGYQDFSFESKQSFRTFYEEDKMVCLDGVERNKVDIWLQSPNRRKHKGLIFDPTTTENRDGYYNLWKGFTRQSLQGNCSLFWKHALDNICSGDQECYLYVRKWLASIFQHPNQVHTALVLCGSQGVGKNSFVEPLGVLLGQHYIMLSSMSELTSNFNSHQKYAVLIHANEALWGGNKKELGTIKTMITEKYFFIEGKGKDRIQMTNFRHVILSSNEDWPVHLDADDRRFYVIRVSEQHKEDHQYFAALQEQLDNGGYEALLYDLLHEDLTDFKPRKMPASVDAFSIKMRSADSTYRYLFDALLEGGFSVGAINSNQEMYDHIPVWQLEVPKHAVYNDYVLWCRSNGEPAVASSLFGKVLNKILPSMQETRPGRENGRRMRCYTFPSLEQARAEFCKFFKEDPMRIFDADEQK